MKRSVLILAMAGALPLAASPAEELYKTKCTMCHGADGSGNTPMGKKLGLGDMRARTTQAQSDAQLIAVIENGKGKMPAQKSNLSKSQMKELVTFLRRLPKGR